MSIRLSDVGRLGLGPSTAQAMVQRSADAAFRELDRAAGPLVTPAVAAARPAAAAVTAAAATMAPSAAAAAFAPPASARPSNPYQEYLATRSTAPAPATGPERVAAPSTGAAQPTTDTAAIGAFLRDLKFVELDSLRTLTAAAAKGEGADIYLTRPNEARQSVRLTAATVKAVSSAAFDDIMRRSAASPTAEAGKMVQSGDSGQKTTELAPPTQMDMGPTSAPKKGLSVLSWVGIGAGALALVGGFLWMRRRSQSSEPALPEQVQGWFAIPKRKRRKSRR